MAFPPEQINSGAYVQQTFILDVSQLRDIDVTKPEFKELLIRLYQNLNLMSNVLNTKDTGLYLQQPIVNSQSWYPDPTLDSTTPEQPTQRQNYRMTIDFGVLPAPGVTKSVAHNIIITKQFTFTRFYGCATNTTTLEWIPLPYVSTTAVIDNLELWGDSTFINIAAGAGGFDYSGYTAQVVFEYLTL